MTEKDKLRLAKWRRYALVLGIVLGIVCHSLPEAYQGPCHQVANICTGNW